MIRYINQSNTYLERFLDYVRESNTTIDFTKSLEETPFKDLSYYFAELNNVIRDAKIERENQYLFLQYIFDHVNVGLIAFDKNNKVKLINSAAKELLLIPSLGSIDMLKRISNELPTIIQNISPQEQKVLPMNLKGKNLRLAIKLAKFKLLNEDVNLISIQDIKSELDHNEVESWQKLNRVLTHEIMNSVSPIIGLTSNISKLLKNNIDDSVIDQAIQSVDIIEERSKGLDDFVKKFRSITSNAKPDFKNVGAAELFEDLAILMHESLIKNKIKFEYSVEPKDLTLYIDKKLIDQVLINLIKNSIEAFDSQSNGIIRLVAKQLNNKNVIEVIDTGKGITSENLDQVFTPFYTTKEGGSGIGLSLSRNILKLHGGSIDVRSIPNVETVFTLYFN
ncbi:PAS domain-containing sensor histidine kinase [Bacteroidota bacterium]